MPCPVFKHMLEEHHHGNELRETAADIQGGRNVFVDIGDGVTSNDEQTALIAFKRGKKNPGPDRDPETTNLCFDPLALACVNAGTYL